MAADSIKKRSSMRPKKCLIATSSSPPTTQHPN